MDESLIAYYKRQSMLLKERDKRILPTSVNTLDELIDFLELEKDLEQYQNDIEHSGDSPDSRVLILAECVRKPIITPTLMLDMVKRIKYAQKKEEKG